MNKAQGTIEYLVIIAVVIVISLIVVGLVISSTDSSTDIAKSSQKLGAQLQNISIMDVLLKPDGNYALDLQSNLIENVLITRIAFDEDYEDFIGDNFLALGSRKLFIVNIEGLRRPDRCVAGSLVTKDIVITYTSSEGLSKTQRLEGLKIPCQVFEVNTGAIALSECPSGQYKSGNECITCTNAIEGMFASGSGSESDPYFICSWEQLNNVRNKLDKSFKLIANLDSTSANYADFAGASANANEGWEPIGDNSTPFIGEFDGQEYTINNLTIGENYSGSYASLFGYISNASISNVNLRDENINETTSTYCGGIAGYSNNSIITSSSFSGTLNCYSDYMGGLIGYMDDGEINYSYNMSDISKDNLQYIGGLVAYVNSNTEINNSYNNGAITGSYYAGGLVAYVNLDAEINNSYNNGNITSNSTSYSGGIIGSANSSITINNSYNFSTANIYSGGAAGGLIGYIGTSGLIENSYNEGPVYGYYVAGGLVGNGTGTIRKSKNSGYIETSSGNYSDGFMAGGIAGVFSGTIQDSYNTGYVDSDYYAGGILGNTSGTISLDGTYNNGTITGGENSFYWCYYNGWSSYCYDSYEESSCNSVNGCNWYSAMECQESSYCYDNFYENESGCNSDPNCYWDGYSSCYYNGVSCYENYDESACMTYDPYCSWVLAEYCQNDCESINNYQECSNAYDVCSPDGISIGAGGGIAGNLSSGDINTSFNTGSISGGLYPGGIVGELNGGSISNSWWDTSLSGQAEGYFGGSTGCTSTNDNAAYYYNSSNPPLSSWDWSTVWLTDGDGYPQFLWEGAIRPYVSLTSPNGTTYLPYQTITFNYSVSSNFYSIASCELYVDDFLIETDNSVSAGTNSFTYNFNYLTNPAEEREYVWNVVCTDTNQNSSINAEKTFNVDFIEPTISLIAPTDTNYISSQIDFNYRPLFNYPINYCELVVNDVILERDESIDNNVLTSFSATISDVNNYSWTVFCSSVNSEEGSGDELSFGVVNSCESSQIRLSNMCLNVCQNYVNGLYFFGDGTSQNPYLICSWEQLNNVRYNLFKYFKLIFDLSDANVGYATYASTSANSNTGWNPIGSSAARFGGNFDGNYNTINDLYINRPATTEQGLFGNISSATISKIYLVDLNIIGKTAVGGIAGKINSSTISDCYANGRIRGEGLIGGIIGQVYTGGSITRCINKSTVTGTNTNTYVGGIVGQNYYAPITNSYNFGNITGVNMVGGIAGYLDAATHENLYNTGVITGTSKVGGIVGYTYNYSLILRNSFNVGAVSGSTYKGGVVGYKEHGTLSNSYWDTTLTGMTQCYSGGNTGCTSTTNTLSRYYNSALAPLTSWNFTTIWLARDNNFPILRWEQN